MSLTIVARENLAQIQDFPITACALSTHGRYGSAVRIESAEALAAYAKSYSHAARFEVEYAGSASCPGEKQEPLEPEVLDPEPEYGQPEPEGPELYREREQTLREYHDIFFRGLHPAEVAVLRMLHSEEFVDGRTGKVGKKTTSRTYPFNKHGIRNVARNPDRWHTSIATTRKPEGPDEWLNLRESNLQRVHLIMLDDIGTKAQAPPLSLGPTMVIPTKLGNGQWHIRLDPPEDVSTHSGRDRIKRFLDAITEAGYSDPGAKGLNRLCRVPGSIKPENGYVANTTLVQPAVAYSLDELIAEMGLTLAPPRPDPRPRQSKEKRAPNEKRAAHESKEEARSDQANADGENAADGAAPPDEAAEVDEVVAWLYETNRVIRREEGKVIIECPWADGDPETGYVGHTDDGTASCREAGYLPLGEGSLPNQRGFKCFHSHKHGPAEFLAWVAAQDGPEVPQFGGHAGSIELRRGDETIMPRIEQLLQASGVEYYVRGGVLQRMVAADGEVDERGVKRPIGAPYLRMVDEPYLYMQCLEHIEFYRLVRGDLIDADPPSALLNRYPRVPEWWDVPPLNGITHVPILREDGSISEAPGYDATTRLLYVPHGARVPSVPRIEFPEQVRSILDAMLHPFREYEWQDAEADRAIFAAGMLAGVLRPFLGNMPLFGFDAPQAGSGKTKLAECISIAATGHRPTPVVFTGDLQEDRKRLDSVLIAGDPAVLIDNLADGTPLEGAMLNAAITGDGLTIRPLGTSVSVKVPSTALFLVTGNHLQITRDVQTRTVICRLEPTCDDAHERTFTSEDPVRVVERERGEIVAQILGLASAWIRAGRPSAPGTYRLPAFDAVRGMLAWAGWADPIAGNRRAVAEDPERERLLAIVHGIERLMGSPGEWRSRDLVAAIGRVHPDPEIRDVAEDLRDRLAGNALRAARGLDPGRLSAQSVGQVLNGFCDCPVRGFVLRKRRDGEGRIRYRIERSRSD